MSHFLDDLETISVPERLQMIQTIWNSIEASQDTLPLSQAQAAELDRRLAAHQANGNDVIPWEEVRSEMMNR